MDQEVARTLGELERKLLELERTLHAMSAEQETRTVADEPASREGFPPAADARPAPPEPAATTIHGPGVSRIVDETIEHAPPPASALHTPRASLRPRAPQPPPPP
ncbi:MAG TPA: hypothetical protein VK272_12565, partial [Solirubrobacteraceae bacterium]|nr:hypothetical protein [Solirubrobacteraceae bacterium]